MRRNTTIKALIGTAIILFNVKACWFFVYFFEVHSFTIRKARRAITAHTAETAKLNVIPESIVADDVDDKTLDELVVVAEVADELITAVVVVAEVIALESIVDVAAEVVVTAVVADVAAADVADDTAALVVAEVAAVVALVAAVVAEVAAVVADVAAVVVAEVAAVVVDATTLDIILIISYIWAERYIFMGILLLYGR